VRTDGLEVLGCELMPHLHTTATGTRRDNTINILLEYESNSKYTACDSTHCTVVGTIVAEGTKLPIFAVIKGVEM
jgi:hypothetical protein